MIVVKLFTRALNRSFVECQQLTLQRGYGIVGDLHAATGNPRQVMLVSQQTLKTFDLNPGDLYENILIDAPIEMLISGQIIQIGEVLIRPTFLCEPCANLETIRKGLSRQIKDQRGGLGMVVKSGTIAVGDQVIQTCDRLPSLPDAAKSRFTEFVARIPFGKVVTTADLILALGVTHAHYRVIPTWLKQTSANLPVHRIVSTDGSLLTRHLPHQAKQLAQEGIELIADRVDDRHRWQPENFHPLDGGVMSS